MRKKTGGLRIPDHSNMGGFFSLGGDVDSDQDVGNGSNNDFDNSIDGQSDRQDDMGESNLNEGQDIDSDQVLEGGQHLSNKVELQESFNHNLELNIDENRNILENGIDNVLDISANDEVGLDDSIDLGHDFVKSSNVDPNNAVNNAVNDNFFLKILIC